MVTRCPNGDTAFSSFYLPNPIIDSCVNRPNSVGMVPVRLLKAKIETANVEERLRFGIGMITTGSDQDDTALSSYYLHKLK